MTDPFQKFQPGLESPASRLIPVTPSDTADLPMASRALNVAQAGFVRVTTIAGDTGQVHIAPGIPFAIRVSRIWATGTTATGIVALC